MVVGVAEPQGNHNGLMSEHDSSLAFEILEHTADIGLRARGRTLEELFENASWGLADILDVDRGAQANEALPPSPITLTASDLEALLVEWMNELILLTEEGRACIAGVQVESVADGSLKARVDLADCDPVPDGTELKAATYHQLSVREIDGGWEATVFFDV